MLHLIWKHFIIPLLDNMLSHFFAEKLRVFKVIRPWLSFVQFTDLLACLQGAVSHNSEHSITGDAGSSNDQRMLSSPNQWIINFNCSWELGGRSCTEQLNCLVATLTKFVLGEILVGEPTRTAGRRGTPQPSMKTHRSYLRKGVCFSKFDVKPRLSMEMSSRQL